MPSTGWERAAPLAAGQDWEPADYGPAGRRSGERLGPAAGTGWKMSWEDTSAGRPLRGGKGISLEILCFQEGLYKLYQNEWKDDSGFYEKTHILRLFSYGVQMYS